MLTHICRNTIRFQNKWIAFFCDPGGEGKTANKLRVAPFSNTTHGFAGVTTVTIGPATEKVTVTLPDDCSGISFQRQDDPGNHGRSKIMM